MSNQQNDEIIENIHYDLEQTLREARTESGMTLRSIASVIVEVLDRDEVKSLVHEIYASIERLQKTAKQLHRESHGAKGAIHQSLHRQERTRDGDHGGRTGCLHDSHRTYIKPCLSIRRSFGRKNKREHQEVEQVVLRRIYEAFLSKLRVKVCQQYKTREEQERHF